MELKRSLKLDKLKRQVFSLGIIYCDKLIEKFDKSKFAKKLSKLRSVIHNKMYENESKPVRYLILQNQISGLEFITHTNGLNKKVFYSQILRGKLGVVNGNTKREWFEHDGIYHAIATKFLTSPLGKFCLNYMWRIRIFSVSRKCWRNYN